MTSIPDSNTPGRTRALRKRPRSANIGEHVANVIVVAIAIATIAILAAIVYATWKAVL